MALIKEIGGPSFWSCCLDLGRSWSAGSSGNLGVGASGKWLGGSRA